MAIPGHSLPCRSSVGGSAPGGGPSGHCRLKSEAATQGEGAGIPGGGGGFPEKDPGGLPPAPLPRRTHMAISNCSVHFLFMSSVLQKNWKPCLP